MNEILIEVYLLSEFFVILEFYESDYESTSFTTTVQEARDQADEGENLIAIFSILASLILTGRQIELGTKDTGIDKVCYGCVAIQHRIFRGGAGGSGCRWA